MTAPVQPEVPTDPSVIRATRLLLRALENDPEEELTPADLEAFLRQETKGKAGLMEIEPLVRSIRATETKPNARSVGRSIAQGASMKYADEAVGALPDIARGASGLGPIGDIFGQIVAKMGGGEGAKEMMRLKDEEFNRQNPKTAAASEIAGAVATSAIPGAGGAKVGATALRMGARGAATGGAVGGLSGAGGAEEGERQEGAKRGAAIGAAAGGALGGTAGIVAQGAAKVLPKQRAIGRLWEAIESTGGMQKVKQLVQDLDDVGRMQSMTLGQVSKPLRGAKKSTKGGPSATAPVNPAEVLAAAITGGGMGMLGGGTSGGILGSAVGAGLSAARGGVQKSVKSGIAGRENAHLSGMLNTQGAPATQALLSGLPPAQPVAGTAPQDMGAAIIALLLGRP